MKLETLVKRLDKARSDYWYRFAKDPHIWDWSNNTLILCGGINRIKPGVTSARNPIRTYKVKSPEAL